LPSSSSIGLANDLIWSQRIAKKRLREFRALLAGINPDTMTEWRKDAEFSGAIKKATAQRLLLRLERIEAGEQGWQGTAWALERIYPHRFARPEVMNQIAVVNQAGKASAERVIVLPPLLRRLEGQESC
jgi:hypothetical protein